jgi:hypothetical protein
MVWHGMAWHQMGNLRNDTARYNNGVKRGTIPHLARQFPHKIGKDKTACYFHPSERSEFPSVV